jgi:L-asparaginase II
MDKITALRLARDGEAPGPIRHQCSGFHAASILLSRFADWTLEDYDRPEHPSQFAVRTAVAKVFGVEVDALDTAVDDCGLGTYAFPLVDVARAYALLADPSASTDPVRAGMAPALIRVRDAMMAAPEMVGGTEGSLDTMLMQQLSGKVVSKGGAEGLRGLGILAGARGAGRPAIGIAVRIEDGDGFARANRAVTMEALIQLGIVDERARRVLSGQHRPVTRSVAGDIVAEAITDFQLAAISELG